MKHILFTARDIGAAHHIKHIANAFLKKGYKITLVASDAAFEFLKKEKSKLIHFMINDKLSFVPYGASKELIDELVRTSYKLLLRIKPDAVFCGLCTVDYGIDEAILYCASRNILNIPSFQFLDTWGTFNHLRNGYPDIYFAIDKATLDFSYKGAKAPIKIVGSPKYEQYSLIPVDRWRHEIRAKLNVNHKTSLIGYFGQNPEIPGYIKNFEEFIRAIKLYGRKYKLLIRLHPAYKNNFKTYKRALKKYNIHVMDVTYEPKIEQFLCACDLVVSCFSTVTIDHAYLSLYANQPIGVTLSLLCNSEIKKYLIRNFGFWKNPLLEKGIGEYADKTEMISKKLNYILDGKQSQLKYFNNTKLLHTHNSSEKILDAVVYYLNRSDERNSKKILG